MATPESTPIMPVDYILTLRDANSGRVKPSVRALKHIRLMNTLPRIHDLEPRVNSTSLGIARS